MGLEKRLRKIRDALFGGTIKPGKIDGGSADLDVVKIAGQDVLQADGKVSASAIPELSITSTFAVADKSERLNLDVQEGDVAIQQDVDTTYIFTGGDPSTDSNWSEIVADPGAHASTHEKGGADEITTLGDLQTDSLDTAEINNDGSPVSVADELQADNGATVNGSPVATGIGEGDAINEYQSDNISVSGNTWHTIFDVADPVSVIGGHVIGLSATHLRVTFESGTQKPIGSDSFHHGDDSAGDDGGIIHVPPIEDITKLEFYNSNSTSRDFGYQVITGN